MISPHKVGLDQRSLLVLYNLRVLQLGTLQGCQVKLYFIPLWDALKIVVQLHKNRKLSNQGCQKLLFM